MNIIDLAILEVEREGKMKAKNCLKLVFERASKIRKYLDNQERNKKVLKSRYKKER